MAPQQWKIAPELSIDPKRKYIINMNTDWGVIEVDIYPEHAPVTINNFVFLTRVGFYDGITFHRVISNFMVQGGDPTGSGMGGPGYKFQDEVRNNPLKHETGVISMANAGPSTNGSQFFIAHAPQPHLNGKHTVFGNVTKGMDVANAIRQGDKMVKVTVAEA